MKWTTRRPVLLAGAILLLVCPLPASEALAQLGFRLTAEDLPRGIPPGAPGDTFGTTVSRIPSVRTLPGRLSDVDVFVNLDHDFPADLDIFVDHQGRRVHLFNQFGIAGSDLRDVLFDDEAATRISSGSPPFGPGAFQPEPGSLSALDGLSLSGDWSLIVVDNFILDTGTLLEFLVEGVVDPDLVPGQRNQVAQAARKSVNSIIPDEFFFPDPGLHDIVTFLLRAGEDEASFALRGLAPDEAFAAGDLSLRQLGWQHRSVRDRLRTTRGAGIGMGPTQLATPGAPRPGPTLARAMPAAASTVAPPAAPPVAARFWDDPRVGVWLAGRGFDGDRDRTSWEMGYDFDGGAGAGGADFRFSDRLLAGLSVGGAAADADFDGMGGRLDSDAVFLTLYGQLRPTDRLYFDLMGSYAWNEFDSRRSLAIGDFAARPGADHDGRTFGFDVSAFYEAEWGALTFGPALGLSYLDARVEAYGEDGGNVASLRISSDDPRSLQTRVGGEIYADLGDEPSLRIAPYLSAHWVHEFEDDIRNLKARFRAFPSATPIRLRSEGPDRDYVELAAGVGISVGDRVRLWLDYETTLFRRDWTENQITGGLAIRF